MEILNFMKTIFADLCHFSSFFSPALTFFTLTAPFLLRSVSPAASQDPQNSPLPPASRLHHSRQGRPRRPHLLHNAVSLFPGRHGHDPPLVGCDLPFLRPSMSTSKTFTSATKFPCRSASGKRSGPSPAPGPAAPAWSPSPEGFYPFDGTITSRAFAEPRS